MYFWYSDHWAVFVTHSTISAKSGIYFKHSLSLLFVADEFYLAVLYLVFQCKMEWNSVDSQSHYHLKYSSWHYLILSIFIILALKLLSHFNAKLYRIFPGCFHTSFWKILSLRYCSSQLDFFNRPSLPSSPRMMAFYYFNCY